LFFAISSGRKIFKGSVILKGLKKVPNVLFLDICLLQVENRYLNANIMENWVEVVWVGYVSFLRKAGRLQLWFVMGT
jgi:hypothetical protein